MEFSAAGFGVADARLFVADLGADEKLARPFEATVAGFRVIRKGADENVGGFVNLADRDQWIFFSRNRSVWRAKKRLEIIVMMKCLIMA